MFPMVTLTLINRPTLHNETNPPQCPDVASRVPVDGNQISKHPWLYFANVHMQHPPATEVAAFTAASAAFRKRPSTQFLSHSLHD